MRILCTSDFHRSDKLVKNILDIIKNKNIDVYINAGDFLSNDFAHAFFKKLKVKTFVVSGNWDWDMKYKGKYVSILEDKLEKYENYYFFGVNPDFANAEYFTKMVKNVPKEKLIFISHSPPYNILDKMWNGAHIGFIEYNEFVKKNKPIIHVFGHIHEDNGIKKTKNTIYINAALAASNKAYIID
ncbi:MAG: metallophosphoesterase family protein, partial [Candidatus Aenigmarchaeota archaeon]|nr:metallophosphoesterase family protein [Candidatus Aenigmarchaeota archaeon]